MTACALVTFLVFPSAGRGEGVAPAVAVADNERVVLRVAWTRLGTDDTLAEYLLLFCAGGDRERRAGACCGVIAIPGP